MITGEMIFRTFSGPKYFGASFVLYASFLLDNGGASTPFPLVSMIDALNYNIFPVDQTLGRDWCVRSQKPSRECDGLRRASS